MREAKDQCLTVPSPVKRIRPAVAALIAILLSQALIGVIAIREKPLLDKRSDEVGHLNMARFVASQRRLPGPTDIADGIAPETLQFTQPPAYYVALAPLVVLIDDGTPIPGQPNPNAVCSSYNSNLTGWARPRTFNAAESGAVRVALTMRVVQLLLGIATTFVTYRVARRLFPDHSSVALGAAALYAFMPSLVSTTAFIGNDLPVILIGALALDVATRRRRPLIRFGLLLALAALAALSKSTGWSVFILLLPVIWQTTSSLRSRRYAGWVIAALVVTLTAIAALNFASTGSLIGRYPLSWLQGRSEIDGIIQPALTDLWGSITQADQISSIPVRGLNRLHLASLALIGIGGLFLILRSLRSNVMARALAIPALLVLTSLALMLVRNLTAPSELFVFAPFRYLGPAIPALAILAAAALWAYPRRIGVRAAVLLAVSLGWLALDALGYTLTPIPLEERASVVAGWTLPADATPLDAAQDGAPLRVAGYRLDPADRFDDGVVALTLYLAASDDVPTTVDVLELNAGDSPCMFSPARGLRPTTSFLPGEMVAAHVELPYCGPGSPDSVEVTLGWRRASEDGGTTDPLDTPPLRLFTISGTPGPAPECHPNLGLFDHRIQMVKADVPPTFDAAGSLSPSINWLALEAVTVAYQRVYIVRDESGAEVARCPGSPRENTAPTDRWQAGYTVFDDRCALTVTGAQPGQNYSVWVGLRDPNDGHFLGHDRDGDPAFVRLGVSVAQ